MNKKMTETQVGLLKYFMGFNDGLIDMLLDEQKKGLDIVDMLFWTERYISLLLLRTLRPYHGGKDFKEKQKLVREYAKHFSEILIRTHDGLKDTTILGGEN